MHALIAGIVGAVALRSIVSILKPGNVALFFLFLIVCGMFAPREKAHPVQPPQQETRLVWHTEKTMQVINQGMREIQNRQTERQVQQLVDDMGGL